MNAARWSTKVSGVLVLGGALSAVACSSAPGEKNGAEKSASAQEALPCCEDCCLPGDAPPDPCDYAKMPTGGLTKSASNDTFLNYLYQWGCRGPNGEAGYLAIPTAKAGISKWWLITECPTWTVTYGYLAWLQSQYSAAPYSATTQADSGYYAYSSYNMCTTFALDSGYAGVMEFDPGCPGCGYL